MERNLVAVIAFTAIIVVSSISTIGNIISETVNSISVSASNQSNSSTQSSTNSTTSSGTSHHHNHHDDDNGTREP